MNHNIHIAIDSILIFLAFWVVFTFITYGTNVPAGLFLPGMIIGCAIGHMYGYLLRNIIPGLLNDISYDLSKKNFIVLAIGGFMAGYTRLTYSLCVILLETSQQINLFIPLLISIFVANNVGSLFTRGLYDRAVRAKQMPILIDKVPSVC